MTDTLDSLMERPSWWLARGLTYDEWRAVVLAGVQSAAPSDVSYCGARLTAQDAADLVKLLDDTAAALTIEQRTVLRVTGTERFPVSKARRLQSALVPTRRRLHSLGLLRYDDSCKRTAFGYHVILTADEQERTRSE